jgi:hypothetical protein
MLDEGRLKARPTRGFTMRSVLRSILVAANALAEMRWTFLQLDPADSDLVLGDHPVTLADVGSVPSDWQPLGVRNPNIEIAMPLNPRTVALAHWDGPISYGELAPDTSDMLNVRSLQHARRFAFASFKSSEMLECAVALRNRGPKMRTQRIATKDGLAIISYLSQEPMTFNK